MNPWYVLDDKAIGVLIAVAIIGGAIWGGWQALRAQRYVLCGLAWLFAVLAALVTYFFATFKMRMM